MTIFEDYEDWKNENIDLINELIKLKSPIISRISHVIGVVDYINNLYNEQGSVEDYLENIFEHGFDYLHDHFVTITTILHKEYRNNVLGMNKNAKTINLLLYVNDFQNELSNEDDHKEEDLEKLSDFEQKVLGYIERHEEAPDELFGALDDLTFDMFDADYRGVNDIMYEVAEELNLIQYPDDDNPIDNVFGIHEKDLQ
ncbi:MAG: hypothetical protein K6G28_00490 [Acholeplasmatales bacterium]|nr:hypothetical protein [Acholeplasmatales bacterium]